MQVARGFAVEAGADAAEIDEAAGLVGADEKRTEARAFLGPAADDNFLAAAEFRLQPGVAADRAIRCVEAFGDNALQLHLARGFENGFAVVFDVVDVADAWGGLGDEGFQERLACGEREVAQILGAFGEQVEGEVDEPVRFTVRDCSLKPREARLALFVQRADFAVDDAVGKFGGRSGGCLELLRPVETFARAQTCLAGFDPQLDAVAVKLDLMSPVPAARWRVDGFAELRRYEVGQAGDRFARRGR